MLAVSPRRSHISANPQMLSVEGLGGQAPQPQKLVFAGWGV
jgi:hypothetical protein